MHEPSGFFLFSLFFFPGQAALPEHCNKTEGKDRMALLSGSSKEEIAVALRD